ncbi:PPC domain-containing DNA-binding protein [Verrucomicrobiota bacterium]
MSNPVRVGHKQTLMGRLQHGQDLLEALTHLCYEEGITLGRVTAIGAVQKAGVAFYDQKEREYRRIEFDRPMELLSLTGNISMKDGKPFIHAHITLGDPCGSVHGGHLDTGTVVYACEYEIHAYSGPELDREYDEATALALWNL